MPAGLPSPPEPGLVALDGNGTLLGGDGATVSDYTRGVLERVQARGIHAVLVTGRPFEKARPTLERAGVNRYVVTENGARAIRVGDGEALYELWVDGAEAAAPVERIRAKFPGRCFFAQITRGGGLIEDSHPWLQRDEQRVLAMRYFGTPVPDLAEALREEGRQCAKCYATVPDAEDFGAAMADVRAAAGEGWEVRHIKQLLPGISNTCEVQSSAVNKADGLSGLCAALGIPTGSVWAFGDDSNDARMLREMGWGVRMANHLPGLAGVGDDVTKFTNEEDGVARYLAERLLGEGG